MEREEGEVMLAFEAMGGDPGDTSKGIDRDTLVRVVQQEFQLQVDVARLIKELDLNGDDTVEYEEFKSLLF